MVALRVPVSVIPHGLVDRILLPACKKAFRKGLLAVVVLLNANKQTGKHLLGYNSVKVQTDSLFSYILDIKFHV